MLPTNPKKKILIIWHGSIVPAYQDFFVALSKFYQVRVLVPKQWTHGSALYSSHETLPKSKNNIPCEFILSTYWPKHSAKYLVPALIPQLISYHPDILYIMDERDRINTAIHLGLAKLLRPKIKTATYSLQNILNPAYHKSYHRLAYVINNHLTDIALAASTEALEVLQQMDYRGVMATIPLSVNAELFIPLPKSMLTSETLNTKIHLLYAGSLHQAKGLALLSQALPLFPHIQLHIAGNGPLLPTLQKQLGPQLIYHGTLTGQDLIAFYHLGDYVILPSLITQNWKEQIGRVLLEAICCGCTALGSNSGYIPQLTLFPEVTFQANELSSLQDLLTRLISLDKQNIWQKQYENILQNYSNPKIAEKTFHALNQTKNKTL